MKTWLDLQFEIDFCLCGLSVIAHRTGPSSPIETMIDAACGRAEHDRKATVSILRNLVRLWRQWQKATGEDVAGLIASAQEAIAKASKTQ